MAEQNWISVDEKMPNDGNPVLIVMKNATNTDSYVGRYYKSENRFVAWDGEEFIDDWTVTHWMPFPTPPK